MSIWHDIAEFFIEVLLPVFSLALLLFAGTLGLLIGWDMIECSGFEKGTGINTRYAWGCYAEVDGQWVPKKYAFGDAHELRLKEKK